VRKAKNCSIPLQGYGLQGAGTRDFTQSTQRKQRPALSEAEGAQRREKVTGDRLSEEVISASYRLQITDN